MSRWDNLRAGLLVGLTRLTTVLLATVLLTAVLPTNVALGQPYGEPDRSAPGDAMIQDYLQRRAERVEAGFRSDLASRDEWEQRRTGYRDEYLYMLGLSPLPERTPLHATITGTLRGDGYEVDMLHYQSRPGLYVTGNLYRPPTTQPGEKRPAVFYVCGHSGRGRNGNKTAFQSHGIWFARHGYICLVVDTLQLGEIAATHHGTYNLERWWWHSRGYTPAGVECWNGVRGIDYLVNRPDVDPQRIAVTGISGGGAATFWIAAADERVQVAVPVSGMADLLSYIPNRVINGHCDCMFLYNTFRWPWPRIAGLVAPRPLLFVNSDLDPIFPMDANERLIASLERLYSLHGASDRTDAVVSVGGHDYRQDIRQAVYRFINGHLKHDAAPVLDSEIDLVDDKARQHPIAPEKLRVFPRDEDLPRDQLNTTIDEHFVRLAAVTSPTAATFRVWREELLTELRRVSFRDLPNRVPPAVCNKEESSGVEQIETEPGILIPLRRVGAAPENPGRIILIATASRPSAAGSPASDKPADKTSSDGASAWFAERRQPGDAVYLCEVRGTAGTEWTRKSPPNYVERSLALLGTTADTGRVWDLIAAARYLRHKIGAGNRPPVVLAGEGAAGVLAAYAALFEPEVTGVVLHRPMLTHMDPGAPQFLNVLRVCDLPHVLGMLAPKPLTISGTERQQLQQVISEYEAASAGSSLVTQ